MAEPVAKPEQMTAAAASELGQIEVSPIEGLARIKADREVVEGLMQRANERREGVPDAVYQRVLKDYQGRLKELDAQARPLRDKAGSEFRRLRDIHGRLRRALDAAVLDRQEIEFRHDIAEMPEEDFDTRHSAADGVVGECQSQFDKADALRGRFLELIEEPPIEAPAPPAPAPPPAARPASPPTVAPAPTAAGKGAPALEFEGDTMVTSLPAKEAPAGDGTSSPLMTLAVPIGRLISQAANGASHVLGSVTTIGRTDDNDVAVNVRAVSRRHARVEVTPEGYLLKDLGSGNGTFVNDERVEERLLVEGDRVRFGTEDFVFRFGE